MQKVIAKGGGQDGAPRHCSRNHTARIYRLGEGRVWSGINQEGFHCSDPLWGCSGMNEQLRGPERIPIKGIGRSGYDRKMQLNEAQWQGSLSLPTGVEHTEENQVRIDLEGSAQRLEAQKGEEDPSAEWSS